MKIWENERGDVWVEQNGEDLLFYGKGENQEGRDVVVVDMEQLVEIVQNTKEPEESLTRLELSEEVNPDQ